MSDDLLAVPSFPGAYAMPVVDASQVQMGVMLMKRVAEGYEGTLYRLPPGASGQIPVADLELVGTGLYDEGGTLIREL